MRLSRLSLGLLAATAASTLAGATLMYHHPDAARPFAVVGLVLAVAMVSREW